jgi:hypothetical protein
MFRKNKDLRGPLKVMDDERGGTPQCAEQVASRP